MPWAAPAVVRLRVSPMTAALGGGVREVLGQAEHPGGGGHDDAAVALLDHVGPGGPGGVERAADVDGQVTGQVLGVGLGEPGPADDAGVVDQDVEAPELARRPRRSAPARPRPWTTSLPSAIAAPPAPTISAATRGGHAGVGPDALHRAAQVVDDDAGPPVGQQAARRPGRCRVPHR